jgi:hypothetical protein
MSEIKSMCGLSIKMDESKEKSKDRLALDVAQILGVYTEEQIKSFAEDIENLYDIIYDDLPDNQWTLYRDLEGDIGLIYITEQENDVETQEFTMSLHEINKYMGEMHPQIRDEYINRNPKDVKVFSYVYSTCCDKPFTF